ncbi:MAG: MATE family efflux transporter [Culturomica sp.]|nr:MATE family efflux transporter [Culturomica sp.]
MSTLNSPLLLGTENIRKLLIKYSLPAIVSMTAASLYNMVDSIFIGHGVGAMGIAGLAITLPFMNIAAAAGALVGVGSSTLMSMKLGQKDVKSASIILGNVVLLNLIIGSIFTIISLTFLDDILRFFGASNVTLPYAKDYMTVILFGNIITHTYLGLNDSLRASGYPKKAMYATLFAIVINVILNYFFIFIFGMGIKGAALATVLSQALALAFIVIHFSDKKHFMHFKRGIWQLNPKIAKGILSIGLSPFLMNACASMVVILINNSLQKFGGDLAIGAYGIVNRIAFLFIMINMGFNQGMQPIAGFNYGARKTDRLMKVYKYTVACTTCVVIIGFIAGQFFTHELISLFSTDEKLMELAARGLHLVMAAFPLVGFQMSTSSFFQSIGMPQKSIFLSLNRQLIFLIPFLFILPTFWGEEGVWLSMPFADVVAFITAAIMIRYQIRKFKKEPK